MSKDLFRTEALTASTDSRFGKHVFHQPLAVRALAAGVVVTFLFVVAFAALVQVKQTEPVRGYLTATEGEVKVYSDRPGVFREIHGVENQRVSKGDILATVTANRFDEGGRQSSAIVIEHTDAQIAQLQERMIALKERASVTENQIRTRIAGLSEELVLLQEEHDVVLKRLALAEQEFAGSAILLERKSISSREHNQIASSWYALQQMSASTRLNIEGRRLALEEASQQLTMQPLAMQEELLSMKSSLSQLLAHRDEQSSQSLFSITAPVDGSISNLVARTGDAADPRIPFATLIPVDAVLEARLYLPSRSVGDVVIGQSIMLAYDAYPYQIHGTFSATVSSISTTAMDPREFLIPLELSEPVYLVRAQIAQQFVGDMKLRTGLQFSAEIITGSDSLLERLLSPLSSLGRRL